MTQKAFLLFTAKFKGEKANHKNKGYTGSRM